MKLQTLYETLELHNIVIMRDKGYERIRLEIEVNPKPQELMGLKIARYTLWDDGNLWAWEDDGTLIHNDVPNGEHARILSGYSEFLDNKLSLRIINNQDPALLVSWLLDHNYAPDTIISNDAIYSTLREIGER